MSPSSKRREDSRRSGAPAPLPRTVGIEEELLLVDARTLVPVPVAGRIVRVPAAEDDDLPVPALEFEVKEEQIEVVSPPLTTVEELVSTVRLGRETADAAARTVGARAVALGTGTVPFDSHLAPVPRYRRMQERFGLTMTEQLTCGLHVHVAVESAEEGVGVLDRIRPWLPVLLAISTNSPLFQGIDTGFASYRYQAWGRWPSAGAYEVFGSAAAYDAAAAAMLRTGVSLDAGMIYSDARLSRHAPTVETRIMDVCLRAEESAALAVITRALVDTAADQWRAGEPADPVPAALLRLASWRASKSGLDDVLLHPRTLLPVPAAAAVHGLLDHVRAHFVDDAEERFAVGVVQEVLAGGTGAARQRAVLAAGGSREDVIAAAARETTAAPPPTPGRRWPRPRGAPRSPGRVVDLPTSG
ncbi:glutamate--cysteine ligase [Microbacterium paraoxydans]|uniref:glutamate--cysteine ligase n=1 Tax=Microbacterium paraoxydans TaxID=199592 RepID=UPI002F26649F